MSLRIDYSVGIVGAGASGICAAIKLVEAGCTDVVVYEKAADLGGTWRDNRYPGLHCDAPARAYCYSFAPNSSSKTVFNDAPTIHSYLDRTARQFDVRRLVQFSKQVCSARWHDDGWDLEFSDGTTARHDAVVLATGYLHQPVLPDIDGMAEFSGESFHSSRWPSDMELDGKRTAVIGSGSSGIQIVAALGTQGQEVLHFQRTPAWIWSIPNFRYRFGSVALHQRFPWLGRQRHRFYQRAFAMVGKAAVGAPWMRAPLRAFALLGLRSVRDPELRRALTPDYEFLCKRPVVSADYYGAIQQPSAALVTDGIQSIESGGIRTVDGRLHEVDVIVYATGFDTHAYMRPMNVRGVDGIAIDDVWEKGARAHRSVMVPGFPNLFLTTGPHSPVATASVIEAAEQQVGFVVRALERVALEDALALHPTVEAANRYYDRLRPAAEKTVWATGGCRSWFIDDNGDVDLWPFGNDEFGRQLADVDLAEYELLRVGRA